MDVSAKDRGILRRLADGVAEASADPVNAARARNHELIGEVRPAKPTVHIYQVPWHELNVNDELTVTCESEFCRGLEDGMRKLLYQWRRMPGDMVMSPWVDQPPCYTDTGFGIGEHVEIARTDQASDVVSRHFIVQIENESDAEKIRFPEVTLQPERTEEEFAARQHVFDGLLPVRKMGAWNLWFAPWDELVRFTGVQEILTDMILRPDYVNLLMDRFVSAWLHRLDQYEALGLLAGPARELWGIGAAQIFSEVSPAMHEEFALRHEARWYERWGMNYYGCCEPLHRKVDIVRRHIPRLRKISMSPWVNFPEAVANVGSDIIFAWKPNPAILAAESWDPDYVRADMREKLAMAAAGGCAVEIHLKDISTVRHHPERLWDWARIAAEVTEEFAG